METIEVKEGEYVITTDQNKFDFNAIHNYLSTESYWAQNISNYNKVYGSIGSLIIIMLLIFLNSLMLLIGYELNLSIFILAAKKRLQNMKKGNNPVQKK